MHPWVGQILLNSSILAEDERAWRARRTRPPHYDSRATARTMGTWSSADPFPYRCVVAFYNFTLRLRHTAVAG